MGIEIAQLKVLLIGSNVLTPDQFAAAERAAKAKQISLEEFLPQSGFIPDIHLGQIVANYLKVGFVDLRRENISDEFLNILPEAAARAQKAMVFKVEADKVMLASCEPNNYELIKMLERKTGKPVKPFYATPLTLKESLRLYKGDLSGRVGALTKKLSENSQEEEKVVELVNLLLEYAYDNRASDIHIEPAEEAVVVRFRIDGLLHEVVRYPKHLHKRLVFRLKILSRLRTDEHDAAQDGRFDFKTDDARFNVRLSILPITNGENVVMRLLSESARRITLEELGLAGEDLEKIKRAAAKPHGMILAVGPTGSGKTTTLYAILQILNEPDVNITTIEDPVEYKLEGVHQTQVNAKKNLTFANGLRSIVRQDPDIILVGEIRDAETASIAVNAAMTGHLLLSTLHANDAATTFPRLIDMGIEPFLAASSVNVVVAQRLVRQICAHCKTSYHLTKEELELINRDPIFLAIFKRLSGKEDLSELRLYHSVDKDCKSCAGTGYMGRLGVFEIMELTDDLHLLITQKAPAETIAKKAVELGMRPMIEDGVNKILQGFTTVEEVVRNIKS